MKTFFYTRKIHNMNVATLNKQAPKITFLATFFIIIKSIMFNHFFQGRNCSSSLLKRWQKKFKKLGNSTLAAFLSL